MLTDSRSFMSFPRHEYFRRVLCDLLGRDVENGELPNDEKLLGSMVRNICFNNAREFLGLELPPASTAKESRMSHSEFKPRLFIRCVVAFLLISLAASSQQSSQPSPQSVKIEVQVDQPQGTIAPIWNYFGYDEPNYTYAPNGKKLLGELAALSSEPAYVRVHNLLTTGDGSASLKWGSTNVYTEDAAGKPVYSWTILDQIFDSLSCSGSKAAG